MKRLANTSKPADLRTGLHPVEKEAVEVFVRIAGLLRLPRSVGEIYGLLYFTPVPLPMDEIRERLVLSKGGTSMGLKTLRSFGAVRIEYIPGDRREHYRAEIELRKLVAGFMRDQLEPHLRSGQDRVKRMSGMLEGFPAEEQKFLQERIRRLGNWQKRAKRGLPLLLKLIRA
jgi:DNA-binding transcriptional regulator GbsR (MarR family)